MKKQLNANFTDVLKQLKMLDDVYPNSTGLVYISNKQKENSFERLAIEKAMEYGVDAVYFRRFQYQGAAIPQIYLFDLTQKSMKAIDIALLHWRLWNAGQVPLFYLITRRGIQVFNCLKAPGYDSVSNTFITSPIAKIQTKRSASRFPADRDPVDSNVDRSDEQEKRNLRVFSAPGFDDGSFWDTSSYSSQFKREDSSYETFLRQIYISRDFILNKKIMDGEGKLKKPGRAETLIILELFATTLLIKYLEERVDRRGNKVFPGNFFSRFAAGARDVIDILKTRGACLRLFDYLEQHFKGIFFSWHVEHERQYLAQSDLTSFAQIFSFFFAIPGQGSRGILFSFKDLPITLIINAFEVLLNRSRENTILYTPPCLVHYLVHYAIDEVIAQGIPVTDISIFDPACGPGVLLAAAYQRIIDKWRQQKQWKRPGANILNRLLGNVIFGTDVSPLALRLSYFSLSLVIFNSLSPKKIWEELKFDNWLARGNLQVQDFFHLVKTGKLAGKFDLVIGNPLFAGSLHTRKAPGMQIEKKAHRHKITPYPQAYHFFEKSLNLCKPGQGQLAFIFPTEAFLYHSNSPASRKNIFKSCFIRQVLDFTSLREFLLGSASMAITVILASKDKPGNQSFLHAIFQRRTAAKENIYLELDHYDLHPGYDQESLNNPLAWKANFLGGGRLKPFIFRLNQSRKLKFYLQEKVMNDNWVVAEGYTIAAQSRYIEKLKKYAAGEKSLDSHQLKIYKKLAIKYQAEYLTGKNTLPSSALTDKGLDSTQVYILKEIYFQENCRKHQAVFQGPHVLIKGCTSRTTIPIAFTPDDLSFPDDIVGIHAAKEFQDELLEIVNRVKGDKVSIFSAIAFCGEHLVCRDNTILNRDIANIPYPGNPDELKLSESEAILMDDVLTYTLDAREKGEHSVIFQLVDIPRLEEYCSTLSKSLDMVYRGFKVYKPLIIEGFIVIPLSYGSTTPQPVVPGEKVESLLKQFIMEEMDGKWRTPRIFKIYHDKTIYLVKPRQIKYWLKSMAIRDADEILEDLVKRDEYLLEAFHTLPVFF